MHTAHQPADVQRNLPSKVFREVLHELDSLRQNRLRIVKDTKCMSLHQLCLYTQTLHDLGTHINLMTNWPIHFIVCGSVNSDSKIPMHLNCLGAMVDNVNILILNPNPFPVTLVLQEKVTASSSSTKIRNKISGKCQLTFIMTTGSVMCVANNMVKNWDVYSISQTTFCA